jgi:hypothetical protein
MDLIQVLKSGKELYSIEFETGIEFQFRLLSMREYRLFNKIVTGGNMPPFFIYEDVFKLCFLNDASYIPANTPMGYLISVGELIYHLSGSQDPTQLLFDIADERKKNPSDSIFEHMRAVIVTAIPRYTLFDIDNLTEKEFIKCFVIAENILSKMNPNFVKLNLKEIYDNLNGKKDEEIKPIVQGENFEKLEQALGHWKVEEARELYQREQENVKLSEADLEALDKAKQRS